jgi:hypothetical protein
MPAPFRIFVTAILFAASSLTTASGQEMSLVASGDLQWRKGNMHTHSYWSDGDNYPEMIAAWYKERGYHFLVFTDHNTLLQSEKWIDIDKAKGGRKSLEALQATFPADWIISRKSEGRDEVRLKTFDEVFAKFAVPQQYLLIQGEEITDRFQTKPIHMCATNTNELIPPSGGDSVVDVMQRNIDAARSRRERSGVQTLVHLNHPNFGYAITAEQLMQVDGENFFEVYNGHPTVHNSGDETHASTERMWDIVNTFRIAKLDLPVMYGLGTDDGHNYFEDSLGKGAQPGRGWVQVLTKSLDPDSLVTALESGQFYSSSGVVLNEIWVKDRTMHVTVKADEGVTYRVDFIGTRKGFDETSTPSSDDAATAEVLTRKYSDQIGTVLKTVSDVQADYELDGTELYVRAVVTSSRVHPNPSEAGEFERAWVQPYVPMKTE